MGDLLSPEEAEGLARHLREREQIVDVDKAPSSEDGEQPWNPDEPLFYDEPAS